MLALMLACAPAAQGQSKTAQMQCVAVHFSGTVRAGQAFERQFTEGLIFRLAPESAGWTIEIRPADDPRGVAEYSYLVSPPYRSSNARFIYPGWDNNTVEQVVTWKERKFSFVLDRQSYIRADRDLNHILWTATEAQYQQALKDMATRPIGGGELTITSSRIGHDSPPSKEKRIAEMEFAVRLTVPASLKVVPELRKTVAPVTCPRPAP